MKLRTASILKNISNYLALVIAAACLLFDLGQPLETILLILAVALVIGSVVLAVVFYRCPSCGASLGNGMGALPERCPQCKASLEE